MFAFFWFRIYLVWDFFGGGLYRVMDLVIVESPAKAKTINKYLGSDYKVLASYGHVRDLPSENGSVLPDDDFALRWSVDSRSRKHMNEIVSATKAADRLVLATDPDREGEAISWHILEVLRDKGALTGKKIARVAFNAITKRAVSEAMEHPRDLDEALINAYLARRALDYLVGFTLSPVLWRKLPGARSAGRVQSVALRLVCEREAEIERFVSEEYWTLTGRLSTGSGDEFDVNLVEYCGDKIKKLDIKNESHAEEIRSMLSASDFLVSLVESKPVNRNPYAPYTTSSLQQDASSRLGFAPSRTMQLAQKLYEGVNIGGDTIGLITYMRTDGVQMASEAISQARDVISSRHGANYLPDSPRLYKAKAKNAQEAHEAIRPTNLTRLPDEMSRHLDNDQSRLYDLIWRRSLASQMSSARVERTTIEVAATSGDRHAVLRATGSVIKFDGYLKVYEDRRKDDDDARLPELSVGDSVRRVSVDATQRFTEPPNRYTEAALIKKMEELGIGRPSTYASILSLLVSRDYVSRNNRQLIPQSNGRVVTSFLEHYFARYVEYDFTAGLEEKLDLISSGELEWKQVMRDFWGEFAATVDSTKELRITEVLDVLNEELGAILFPARDDGVDSRSCPSCGDGKLSLKVGRFGAFVGCTNHPDCKFTRQIGEDGNASAEERVLGEDGGDEIHLKVGRFGPYVQRGENGEPEKTDTKKKTATKKKATPSKKPPRCSIPKDWDLSDMTLERALKLLSLPRVVGDHPDTGKVIKAGLGKFGPFVLHDGVYANLESADEIFEVGLNRAVDLLAEKGKKRGGVKLGKHPGFPNFGGEISIKKGRFGAYANLGKLNATIPSDTEPSDVTLEAAIDLLNKKAEKTGKGPDGKKI